MRLMPFLQARDSVEWVAPVVQVHGVSYSPLDPIESWDYRSPLTVMAGFRVDGDRFLEETGVYEVPGNPLQGVEAVIQVDCLATGQRYVGRRPLSDGTRSHGGTVAVDIPAGEVANQLEVQLWVILARADQPARGRAADRCGSRLHSHDRTYRFDLEGTAGGFPTEAASFQALGCPSDAAWWLHFNPGSLDDQFLAVTRLFINTDHPAAEKLLSGRDAVLHSVLQTDIILSLLTHAALNDLDGDGEEEGSVGDTLNALTGYLGLDLGSGLAKLRQDPANIRARFQEHTSFLRGVS